MCCCRCCCVPVNCVATVCCSQRPLSCVCNHKLFHATATAHCPDAAATLCATACVGTTVQHAGVQLLLQRAISDFICDKLCVNTVTRRRTRQTIRTELGSVVTHSCTHAALLLDPFFTLTHQCCYRAVRYALLSNSVVQAHRAAVIRNTHKLLYSSNDHNSSASQSTAEQHSVW